MSDTKIPRFFMGANTPEGFVSLFDEIEEPQKPWHTFLIKGGPGTGKSSTLKRIASSFAPSSPSMEIVPCSSDPDSLDAVILPDRHVSIMDATFPHAREAAVPAVRDTILNFGEYLDSRLLQENREEIEQISASIGRCGRLSSDFLAAAHSFIFDAECIALEAADLSKIEDYACRFASRNLHRLPEAIPCEKHRFLTAIHAGGVAALENTPAALCRKIYLIEDDIGTVSGLLLDILRNCALQLGHSVISCLCPMDPYKKIDHLLIPSAGIAFLTANRFHPMDHAGAFRRIHAKRFLNQELMHSRKNRLSFDRKASRQLLEQAVEILRESRGLHDRLEYLYQSAMDFNALEQQYPVIFRQILDFSQHEKN